jgi:hypothetical protein
MATNDVVGARLDPEMAELLRAEARKNKRNIGAELSLMIAEAVALRRERAKRMAATDPLAAMPRMETALPRRKAR